MNYSTLSIRAHAVNAYLDGESVNSISEIFGIHRATVYRWIDRYNENKSLKRNANPGSGRRPILSDQQINKLTKLILNPASKYGYQTDFWTIKRIIEIAKRYLSVKISKTTMYGMLYNQNYYYKKPEKRYYEADGDEQNEWIRNIIPTIKKCVKKHRGILYFEDESNVSLNAVLGKTWGPIVQKTIHKSTSNRASVSAMSAISNDGRLIFTLHEKRITSIEIIQFLDQMLKHHPKRHIVVVMDNAPPHTSGITVRYIKSKKRLHVFYLPARSPELNPDEKVWNHLKNEELKSHQEKNKKELTKITNSKLKAMSNKHVVYFSERTILRGHYAYYGLGGNYKSLWKVYRFAERYWHKMLCSRSHKSYITWDKFNLIQERHPIQLPKLKLTFAEMQALAVL